MLKLLFWCFPSVLVTMSLVDTAAAGLPYSPKSICKTSDYAQSSPSSFMLY